MIFFANLADEIHAYGRQQDGVCGQTYGTPEQPRFEAFTFSNGVFQRMDSAEKLQPSSGKSSGQAIPPGM